MILDVPVDTLMNLKLSHIDELDNIIKRNYQTLSYFGINKIEFDIFFQEKKTFGY